MNGEQQLIVILTCALIIGICISFKLWLNYLFALERLPYKEKALELHNEKLRLEVEKSKTLKPNSPPPPPPKKR